MAIQPSGTAPQAPIATDAYEDLTRQMDAALELMRGSPENDIYDGKPLVIDPVVKDKYRKLFAKQAAKQLVQQLPPNQPSIFEQLK